MKVLSKIALRPKLLVLVLFPMLFLGYFIFDKIDKEQNLIDQHEEVRQKINLIAEVSVLMHELQIERDYSVNYLVNPIFDNQIVLQKQIAVTSKSLKKFKEYVVESKMDSSYLELFNDLQNIRADITWFNVNSEDVEAYFNKVINRFLDLVTLTGSEAKTAKTKEEITALISLLNAKENLGKIRNKVNEAFIFGRFQKLGYGYFSVYKGAFESNLTDFIKFAPEGLKQRFKMDFQGGSISNTLEMMDYCFENGNNRVTAFTSESWWLSVTGALNILHELELFALQRISDNLSVQEEELKQNISELYLFFGSAITILLILLTLTINSITSQLKRIQKAAEAIQLGDTLVKIPVYTNDEVGKLAEGFNSMASTANLLAQAAESIGKGNLDVEIEARSKNDVLGEALKTMKDNLKQTRAELKNKINELEEAYEYKSEFLANMSHELRTPLNSLLILSEVLSANKKGNLVEDQIESLNVINRSGKNLLNLINDILDLSKIEAGKLDVNLEKVDIESILQNIKDVFLPVAHDKNIYFHVHKDDVPQFFESDSLRIEQILKNLISNALKFTPKNGHVHLKVLQENQNLVFEVIDTGIGIPKDKLQSVFDAFKQADGSTSRNYGGTGLGLSITKNLVHLLAGEISVESEVEKGSKFLVKIPLVPIAEGVQQNKVSLIDDSDKEFFAKNEGKEPSKKAEVTIDDVDLTGKKLMVIDEDITNVFELSSKLSSTNIEILEASDKTECETKYKDDIQFIIFNPSGFDEAEKGEILTFLSNVSSKVLVNGDSHELKNATSVNLENDFDGFVYELNQKSNV